MSALALARTMLAGCSPREEPIAAARAERPAQQAEQKTKEKKKSLNLASFAKQRSASEVLRAAGQKAAVAVSATAPCRRMPKGEQLAARNRQAALVGTTYGREPRL